MLLLLLFCQGDKSSLMPLRAKDMFYPFVKEDTSLASILRTIICFERWAFIPIYSCSKVRLKSCSLENIPEQRRTGLFQICCWPPHGTEFNNSDYKKLGRLFGNNSRDKIILLVVKFSLLTIHEQGPTQIGHSGLNSRCHI